MKCAAAAAHRREIDQRRRANQNSLETQAVQRERPMRAVLQRVSRVQVTVEERVTGQIGAGLLILLGVGREDTSAVVVSMANKVANLRIFEDEQGR